MTETYVCYPVFSSSRARVNKPDVGGVSQEVENLFKEWDDRVQLRGTYVTSAFTAGADLMMWWIASSAEHLNDLMLALRRTSIGQSLFLEYSFFGVSRPPETAPDHLPAFLRGEPPRRYACVYPFVRTPEWYLLPKEERAALLKEHGEMGREYPGVLPNTTSAFGLGDWEWILAFEADDLTELVDCIRRLRDSKSRLYVKEETPFVTGIRKELPEAIRDVI